MQIIPQQLPAKSCNEMSHMTAFLVIILGQLIVVPSTDSRLVGITAIRPVRPVEKSGFSGHAPPACTLDHAGALRGYLKLYCSDGPQKLCSCDGNRLKVLGELRCLVQLCSCLHAGFCNCCLHVRTVYFVCQRPTHCRARRGSLLRRLSSTPGRVTRIY